MQQQPALALGSAVKLEIEMGFGKIITILVLAIFYVFISTAKQGKGRVD